MENYPPQSAKLESVRILIVEDEPGDAALVRIALRRSDGFDLHHEETLAGALDWLHRENCDVMLLDLGLPDSQGFGTISEAKAAAPALPIIVLTGHDDPDFALAALEAGAQDYLIKGDFTGGSLQRAIRYAIARKSLEDRIRQAEQQLRAIVSMAPQAILVLDSQGRMVMSNRAAEAMFGRDSQSLLGQVVDHVVTGLHERLGGAGAAGQTVQGEGMAGALYVEFAISPMNAEGSPPSYLVMVQDVSERKRAEAELKRLAVTDPLTGLANRRRFEEFCDREILRFRRYDVPCSLMMLDIDHFKQVNDTYGHAAGDKVLSALAESFHTTLRSTDLPARLGGEEFAILLPLTGLEAALEIGERVRSHLEQMPVAIVGESIHFTVSLGVAAFRKTDVDADEALRRADMALYKAKHAGRNRVGSETPD